MATTACGLDDGRACKRRRSDEPERSRHQELAAVDHVVTLNRKTSAGEIGSRRPEHMLETGEAPGFRTLLLMDLVQRLRHFEVMLQRRQGLARPILQLGVVAGFGITLK
jgi:hypothetical protein